MKSALHCLFSKKIKSTGFTPLSQSNQATEAIVSIFVITCVKYTYIWCEHRSQQRQGYLKHLCPQRKMNISSIRFYENINILFPKLLSYPSVSTFSQRHSLINSIKLELTDAWNSFHCTLLALVHKFADRWIISVSVGNGRQRPVTTNRLLLFTEMQKSAESAVLRGKP